MAFPRSAAVVAALIALTALIVSPGLTQGVSANPQTLASQGPQSAIVAAVKRALSGQSELRGLAVSADGSQVTLTGRVPTLWHKLDAVHRTLKVDGVKTVVSEMELPKPESDTNLAQALRRAIDGYAYYTMFDYLDATIRKGVITLTGSVTPERNKVEELGDLVARLRGVQDLQNQVVMLPTSQGDAEIRASLYTRISNNESFENLPLDRQPPFHIVVDRGTVTLYGWVQGEIEYRQLETLARYTTGVLRVTNNLKTVTKRQR